MKNARNLIQFDPDQSEIRAFHKRFSLVRAAVRHYALLIIGVPVLLSGCAIHSGSSLSKDIQEIRPGVLQGYLAEDELPDSLALLPPPPGEGSAALAFDQEVAAQFVAQEDNARKAQAIQDNILAFPEATEAFNGVLPFPISEENTPHLYMVLRRTLADAGLSTYAAKNHYQRPRPFMVNETPTLTPEEEAYLREDGSYPSGHTAVGWAWALILTELFPEQSEGILKRGKEFGISRMVCNAHWHSDVAAGRIMGAATVARLHADQEFLIDLDLAKQEVLQQTVPIK